MNSTISAASLLPHYFRVYFIAFTTLLLLVVDADGQSPVRIDSARTLGSGTHVTVAGWVTTQDLVNGHVFIQDETAGIGVASSELADITEIGDSVVVTGTLSYFGQSPFPAGRTDGMLPAQRNAHLHPLPGCTAGYAAQGDHFSPGELRCI